jgi:hypothetical protein
MCTSDVRLVTDVASLVEISSTPEMLTVRYIRYFIGCQLAEELMFSKSQIETEPTKTSI